MSNSLPLAGARILIVDDEEVLRQIFRMDFERQGAVVFEAGDGLEAYAVFQREPLDLILTDHRMPRCTGLEFLVKLQSSRNQVPVIVVTGYSETPIEQLYVQGADAILEKPFDMAAAMEKIVRVLQKFKGQVGRKVPRIRTGQSIAIEVVELGVKSRAKVLNLSMYGMFVAWCHPKLAAGMTIRFSLDCDADKVTGAGKVCWRSKEDEEWQPRGFGVEFETLEKTDRERLLAFIGRLQQR